MFEKFIATLVLEGGIFVVAAIFLVPGTLRAQVLVPTAPVDHRQSLPLVEGLPVDTADDPLPSAGRPSVSINGQPGQEAGPDALIGGPSQTLADQYRREAGKLGPRKLFSDYKIKARASVSVAYDDNILATSGDRARSDEVTTLVGGATLLLGDFAARERNFLVLDYAATGELFAKNSGEDALNHNAFLFASYRPHDVLVQLTSTYALSHDATADVGERVGRQLFGEGLLLRYFRNDHTTLETEANYSRSVYAGLDTSDQIAGGIAADYLVVDRVTLGAGLVFGNLSGTGSLDENFQQLQGRFGYSVSTNITLSLRAGVEVRETGGTRGTQVNPVFSLSGSWTPFGGTTLTAEGHRRTEASAAVAGDDFISTGIQFGIRQRFLERFFASLEAGYENADYQNVTSGNLTGGTRNDNYVNLRATVGYEFVEWFKLEAFYQYRTDRSNESSYQFSTNRVGLQASFVY